MNLLEAICKETKQSLLKRSRIAIDHLKKDMYNVSGDGRTSVQHYNWITNFNLSQKDMDRVVRYFTDEGISVSLQGRDIRLDWSNGMETPCPQCNQYHQSTCNE